MAIEKLIETTETITENMSSVNNMETVINNEDTPIDTNIELDVTMAGAYQDSIACAEHREEVEEQLAETAEAVITADPEAPEVKIDTIYTKKLVLDESIEDFKLIDGSKDDEDRYVEFDMFDFIYSLFSSETDSLVRPLKAFSNYKKRDKKNADTPSSFMYQGSDDYIDETGEKGVEGVSQISTDTDGNVVLYQDNEAAFDKVIELCEEYGFEYDGPNPKKAPWVRWNFSLTITVPTYADGYPMDVEDYFEKQGIAIEDVMPVTFIKGRQKDYNKMNNEVALETTYEKFVRKAANSNDPLENFIKAMFTELNDQGVKFDRTALKKRFLDEFDDGFEDEE